MSNTPSISPITPDIEDVRHSEDDDRGVEGGKGGSGSNESPAAGPHATPELTNPDATPGAGSLPDEEKHGDADGGAG